MARRRGGRQPQGPQSSAHALAPTPKAPKDAINQPGRSNAPQPTRTAALCSWNFALLGTRAEDLPVSLPALRTGPPSSRRAADNSPGPSS